MMMLKYLLVLILVLLISSNQIVNGSKINSDEKCTFCEFVIQYFEDQLESSQNEQLILGELEKVCNFIPESLQDTCSSLIMDYGEEFFKMVVSKENSTVICNQFNMCSKSSELSNNKNNNEEIEKVSDQVTCSICNFITEETEKYIRRGVNDSQIINILDNDCQRFGDYESTCENIVAWYTPTIIYLLDSNQPPQAVCAEIKLC